VNSLSDAVQVQQRALGDFQRSRGSAQAWSDDQRESLDRQVLDPIEREARHLLEALRRAGAEFDGALARLPP
jgi:SOS-response transcriptional repressor LexA